MYGWAQVTVARGRHLRVQIDPLTAWVTGIRSVTHRAADVHVDRGFAGTWVLVEGAHDYRAAVKVMLAPRHIRDLFEAAGFRIVESAGVRERASTYWNSFRPAERHV